MKKLFSGIPLIKHKRWLIGIFVLFFVLTSCAPEVIPEVEPPTPTVTFTTAPTNTVAPTPVFTPTPTAPAGLAVDPDDLAGTVLRFAHPWVGEPAEVLESIAKEFSLTNPWDIWVEVYPHGGETMLLSTLQNELDHGEMPGLIAVTPYLLSGLAGDFSLVDLNGMIYDPEWGLMSEEREDIYPVILEPFIYEDQIVGMPFAPQATVLFYNRTWGEALGHTEPPRDLDSFRTQTFDAAFVNWRDDKKPGGTGGWQINLDPAVLAGWYYVFDGSLPKTGVPSFNNPIGQDAFGYLWNLKSESCIWFSEQPEPYTYFADRLALIYAGKLDQVPAQMSWMAAVGSEDEWEVIGFPAIAGEMIIVESLGLMITADTPQQELAAWLFTKHLLEPEVQAKLTQRMFTLPVRESAMDLLTDFMAEYPQWAQGAAMIESAHALPVSTSWGVAQWALQDAVNRILQGVTGEITPILEQLDDLIIDLAGPSP